MKSLPPSLLALGLLALSSTPSVAAPPPTTVGRCSESWIQSKRFRMVPSPGDAGYSRTNDDFGKEVLIQLTNGVGIYSGHGDDFILSSNFAAGHRVRVCLDSLPQHCPPGDNRGKRYSFYDLQTGARTSGADSWHLCGGA